MEIKKKEFNKSIINYRIGILLSIVLATSFLTPELFSTYIFFTGLFVFLVDGAKIKKKFFKFCKPLVAVLLLGFIGFWGHQFRHIFRDVLYAIFPISLIYIGYWLASEEQIWPKILRLLVVLGLSFSLIHLSQFILDPQLLAQNIDTIRQSVVNPGGNFIILSIVLGMFQKQLKLGKIFPKFFPKSIGLIVLAISFLLSFSRTGLITLIILSFCILGFISKINWRSVLGLLILIASFVIMLITTPADESGTFRSKMLRSVQELAVSDYEERFDINSNWRGFETFLALKSFQKASIPQKIIGQGFGALVDLGFTMTLVEIEFDEIPILHNGYAYILVKTGLIGLFFYLLFYFRLLKQSLRFKDSKNHEELIYSRFLLGLTLCLMSSMFVVGGMAEIHDSEFIMLVGFNLKRLELSNTAFL